MTWCCCCADRKVGAGSAQPLNLVFERVAVSVVQQVPESPSGNVASPPSPPLRCRYQYSCHMHPQSLDSDANRPPLQSYAPVHMARLGPADFQPRQFGQSTSWCLTATPVHCAPIEYCPAAGADMLAIGSCNGDLVVVDWNDNRVINRGAMSGDMLDDKAILSLSWLHGSSHSNMFFAGNSMGSTALYKVVAGAERLALCHDYGTICKFGVPLRLFP